MKNSTLTNTTTKRIDRITETFKRSPKRTQAQMLNRLKYEATFFAHDNAVQGWLINFEQTLRSIGGKN